MSSLRQRRLDEDTSKQEQSVMEARRVLAGELDRASNEAKLAARETSKGRRVELRDYLAAHLAVLRAEEALAIALTDLASASGEDV